MSSVQDEIKNAQRTIVFACKSDFKSLQLRDRSTLKVFEAKTQDYIGVLRNPVARPQFKIKTSREVGDQSLGDIFTNVQNQVKNKLEGTNAELNGAVMSIDETEDVPTIYLQLTYGEKEGVIDGNGSIQFASNPVVEFVIQKNVIRLLSNRKDEIPDADVTVQGEKILDLLKNLTGVNDLTVEENVQGGKKRTSKKRKGGKVSKKVAKKVTFKRLPSRKNKKGSSKRTRK
jgi:hypothetical protein